MLDLVSCAIVAGHLDSLGDSFSLPDVKRLLEIHEPTNYRAWDSPNLNERIKRQKSLVIKQGMAPYITSIR
jgi:hypothetical protein